MFIAQLDEPFHSISINRLCSRNDDGKVVVICFQAGNDLLKFAEEFCHISSNALFKDQWSTAVLHASSVQELKLADLYCSVWQPCLKSCHQLVQSLIDLSIKLSDVDKYLKSHKADLDKHLNGLFNEVNKTIPVSGGAKYLSEALRKVYHYWNLCQYHEGANILLELKDSLGLTQGDFGEVEMLSEEVNSICY